MTSRLPILLVLAVALFTGFVPLRRCHASEGGSGVVALGQHGHAHDAPADAHDAGAPACAAAHARLHACGTPHRHERGHVHAQEGCLHDVCGCEHDGSTPSTHERCCVDTPFDAGLGGASVVFAPAALAPVCLWAGAAAEPAPATPSFLPARADAPPDALRSVRTTVLLR